MGITHFVTQHRYCPACDDSYFADMDLCPVCGSTLEVKDALNWKTNMPVHVTQSILDFLKESPVELKYFKLEEFKCPCCGEVNMDQNFLIMLDNARGIAGIPFKVTSGYRCDKHNAEVGGVSDSSHNKGMAADIAVADGRARFLVVSAAIKAGFTRIGIAKTFVHLDSDDSKDPSVVWLY